MDSGSMEALKDQGAMIRGPSFDDNDFEGHRAHTLYVGLHLPGQRRRHKHKHRHRHSKKNGNSNGEDKEDDWKPSTPPSQRIQFILGEEGECEEGHESHPLFSEMEELICKEGEEMEWRETARWIKFEEDVEEGGNRWSKPHVATLSLHSLFELRSCIMNGTVMLDMDAPDLTQIADLVLENMINTKQLDEDQREKVREALLRRHRHQHERQRGESKDGKTHFPMIRSLADIGRNLSHGKALFSSHSAAWLLRVLGKKSFSVPGTTCHNNMDVLNKSDSGPSLKHSSSGAHLAPGGNESQTEMQRTATSTSIKGNSHFMKKIPQGAEASNILVGEVNFLNRPCIAFVRLTQAILLGDLTEVPVPTRFLFILLGPQGNSGKYHEIGRAIATLMSDEIFHDIAYKAKNRHDLLAGIDEFLDSVTVLPPGEWDPTIRIEPPSHVPSQESRKKPEPEKKKDEEEEESEEEDPTLKRTGKLFGGLIADLRRKLPWYWSDIKDAFAVQCLATTIFLYFACLTPIITFGGLLGDATGNYMAAMESIIGGAMVGIAYSLFSGQPLTIMGSTGPVLVFETILYQFCKDKDWEFLQFRVWIGLWTMLILLILVATDASSLVCYITRFTEESFAALISFIFIFKAFEKLYYVQEKMGVNPDFIKYPYDDCHCEPKNNTNYSEFINWTSLNRYECKEIKGILVGPTCKYYPDIFLLSVIEFLGTYVLATTLKNFKTARFFPTSVRHIISDFGVLLAIVFVVVFDAIVGLHTPKLIVPSEFRPTNPARAWFFDPIGNNPWWLSIAAIVPALLVVILIFMDQQITAVIVNRKENKLKKGGGYHLDLLLVAVMLGICSVLGLPWFVAATVLSMTHVNSLKVESACTAPGERPQFLGVREQRVTGTIIFILIGCSVGMTKVLKVIPMPVLYGVFLYMGLSSLKGVQLVDRLLIMFMPPKYQPDYTFLRHVPAKRCHLFTSIQVLCLSLLWIIKSFKETSIAFPLMVLALVGIRKLLDYVFTQRELKMLDDVMPEHAKRKKEEDTNLDGDNEEQGMLPIADSGNVHIPLANGNVMTIPIDKVQYSSDINISAEVDKTGIWRSLSRNNSGGKLENKEDRNKKKTKKKRGCDKDAIIEEEKKRLSTMDELEEEEDGPITIKIHSPTPTPSREQSPTKETKVTFAQPEEDEDETSV